MTHRTNSVHDTACPDGSREFLKAIAVTLRDGRIPDTMAVPADEETRELLEKILADILASQQFARSIAEGDLSQDLALKGYTAGALKSLQSSLRHLTWQARQIAGGDLSQRVSFMGDFSDAFNVMVEHLSEDRLLRERREEEERLTRERFETLVKVAEMRDAGDLELSRYVMQAACRMTGSTLAFIGTMNADETVMDITAWSESAMQDCGVVQSPIHFPIEKAGIWADAVRNRTPKIVNDYSAPQPGKKGLPEGHVSITRFLSLPVLENGKVVLVAAVANKPDSYDDADVTRLTLLMQGVWGNLQRRRAEKALIKSETLLNETGAIAKVGGLEIDVLTKDVRMTRETYRIFEIPEGNSYDLSIVVGFFDLPGRSLLETALQRCTEHGVPFDLELPFTTATGRHLWTRANGRAVTEAGRTVRIIGTFQDITDRKKMEEALKESEEKFRGVAERSSDIIMLTDDQGRTTYIAPSVERILGYGPGEVVGSIPADFVHPGDLERVHELISKIAAGGTGTGKIEARVRKKDGDFSIMDMSVSAVIKDGNFSGMQVLGRDITERKRAEEELRHQAEIIDQTHDSIITTDMEGMVTSWNKGAERLYGYTLPESLGRNISFIYPDNELDTLSNAVIAPLIEKGSHEVEVHVRRKTGEIFPAHLSLSLVRDQIGTPVGMIGYYLDITSRKLAEDAVESALKLNQLIDTMSIEECMSYTLDEAERLTSSSVGFFHFVNEDERTIQLVTWSTETKKHCYIPKEPDRQYPVEKAGVWVDCIRERKPVIHNDYASLLRHRGLPKGHVPVIRELGVPIIDTDKIVAIIGVGNKASGYDVRDVTVITLLAKNAWTLIRRKRAEEEMGKTQQKIMEHGRFLQRLIDTIPNPIFYKNRDGIYTGCNTAFEGYIGVPKEQVIGKSVYDIAPRELADIYYTHDQKLLENPGTQIYESRVKYADGSVHDVIFNKATYADLKGNVDGLVGVILDITERKKVEDDLRQSEERYRILFDDSPISLWEEDFSDIKYWYETKREEGVRDFLAYFEMHPEDVESCVRMVHVTRINRATMALFGTQSGKEFTHGLSSVFIRESYSAFRDELIALFSGKTGFECEVPVRTVSGEKKIVLLKMIVVPGFEQTLEKIIISFIDITEHKRMQDALQQANKKIKMLSSITRHDIRNQLMALRGYLDLSQTIANDPALLDYIHKEDRAAEAISNQIEFTKYYEEIGVNAPEWQDILQLVHSVRSQLPALDPIEMMLKLPPVKVFADALIEKVFYNLMENTLRHGGRVSWIRVSFHETDSGAEIVYEDDGVGISYEDKGHLFQKGFGKNTGLGLFLTQEILAITGLTIRETGEPGKGARFVIAVPKGAYRFSGDQ